MEKVTEWKGCLPPQRQVMEGKYVRLEPLDAARHGDQLHATQSGDSAERRIKYLWEEPTTREHFQLWIEEKQLSQDPIFFAVIDKASGKVGGRQTFLHMRPEHGVVEIGGMYRGALIAQRPAATEAVYLFLCHAFDELGYRRVEWKCHNDNAPSKRAAVRFGFKFEALFRNHFVMKGENRDSSWYSILDCEWPKLKVAFENWLSPDNFDENGTQKRRLEEFR